MGMIKLTGPVSSYNVTSGWDLSKYPAAADAVKQGKALVAESNTVPADTIIQVSDKLYSVYDMTNKQSLSAMLVTETIPNVVDKGGYIPLNKYSNNKYEPPAKAVAGDFGPPHKWQLLIDKLKVHANEDVKSKTIGSLKKGKVYTLQQVFGSEPMYRCVEAKGYVALADPSSGKFFWNLVTSDGKIIDVNKASDKPKITPTKAPSFGIQTSAPAQTPTLASETSGGLSTTTIVLIAGGALLALLLLLPPSGGKAKAA